jgi:hypothetical protein
VYVTLVRFADGTEDEQEHPQGSPAGTLAAAVEDAEYRHGCQPHAGAWLEFRTGAAS